MGPTVYIYTTCIIYMHACIHIHTYIHTYIHTRCWLVGGRGGRVLYTTDAHYYTRSPLEDATTTTNMKRRRRDEM